MPQVKIPELTPWSDPPNPDEIAKIAVKFRSGAWEIFTQDCDPDDEDEEMFFVDDDGYAAAERGEPEHWIPLALAEK